MDSEDVETLLGHIKALNRRLRREKPAVEGLPTAALVVLTVAARSSEAQRPGELAAELQMTTPNMAAALRTLEEAGMVKRRPDPSDGRKVFVDVSAYGHEVVERTSNSRHAWLHEAVENVLNEHERRLLFEAGELLQRLADYDGSFRRSKRSKAN